MKTPGGKLQPDDIEPGMFVTVLDYHDVLERFIDGPDLEIWSRPAQTGVGLAFTVAAVDMPFIVLRCASCDCGAVITFDMRAGDLKQVSAEYVAALRSQRSAQRTYRSMADMVATMLGVPPLSGPCEPMQGPPPKT